MPGMGEPSDHHLLYWRESQVSKGTSVGGYQGEVMVFPTVGVNQKTVEVEVNGDGQTGGVNGGTREIMVVLAGNITHLRFSVHSYVPYQSVCYRYCMWRGKDELFFPHSHSYYSLHSVFLFISSTILSPTILNLVHPYVSSIDQSLAAQGMHLPRVISKGVFVQLKPPLTHWSNIYHLNLPRRDLDHYRRDHHNLNITI